MVGEGIQSHLPLYSKHSFNSLASKDALSAILPYFIGFKVFWGLNVDGSFGTLIQFCVLLQGAPRSP